MTYHFSVVITQDADGTFVAHVPTLRGCHTQAKTLSQLNKRLPEAIALCMEVEKEKRQPIPQNKFIAIRQIEVKL